MHNRNMKKKFVAALILACAATCLLSACSPGKDDTDKNENTTPPITDTPKTEYEIEIKSTFAKKYGLDVSTVELVKCETRDAIYAVYACGDSDALSYETVGAITFIFPTTPHQMEIYYHGRFYEPSTAYYKGLLTYDDWFNLATKRGKYWYRLDEEKWAEIKRTSDEIKSVFAAQNNVSTDTVWFHSYGEYNGAYPVMITSNSLLYATVITYDYVGEIILTYPSSQKMDVYYKGEFYSLPAAYRNGLLTDSDLVEIAKRYGGYYPE